MKKTPTVGPFPSLDALHIRYRVQTGKARKPYITAVRIPWKFSQWSKVLNRQGPWLSVCCANISRIRDLLFDTLLEDRWFKLDRFAEVTSLMRGHDGFADWFEDGFVPTDEVRTDPLYQLAEIWFAVKDLRVAEWTDLPLPEDSPGKTDHGWKLEHALTTYNYLNLFHTGDPEDETAKASRARNERERLVALAGMWSSLRDFYREVVDTYGAKVIDCFAVVRKGTPTVPVDLRSGPALFSNEKEAEKTLSFWTTDENVHREDFLVLPCTITVGKGIVIEPPPGVR